MPGSVVNCLFNDILMPGNVVNCLFNDILDMDVEIAVIRKE